MATNKKEDKYTFFWSSSSPFSQWHPCEFTVDRVMYNCAEQYMMHKKAELFNDEEMAKQILQSKEPKHQKALGRKVSNFEPVIWGKNCVEIVKSGNMAKFSQNEDLRKSLLETVGTVLVEASPRDCIWGIGLGANNSKALRKATWRGKNLLGYALTQVRDEIIKLMDTQGAGVDVNSTKTNDKRTKTNDEERDSKKLKCDTVAGIDGDDII